MNQEQLVQQPAVPLTLEEYMPREWFEIVEEKEKKEEEEEVLFSCRMIIVDIDFQNRRIGITQDNRTRNDTTISTYTWLKSSTADYRSQWT